MVQGKNHIIFHSATEVSVVDRLECLNKSSDMVHSTGREQPRVNLYLVNMMFTFFLPFFSITIDFLHRCLIYRAYDLHVQDNRLHTLMPVLLSLLIFFAHHIVPVPPSFL